MKHATNKIALAEIRAILKLIFSSHAATQNVSKLLFGIFDVIFELLQRQLLLRRIAEPIELSDDWILSK